MKLFKFCVRQALFCYHFEKSKLILAIFGHGGQFYNIFGQNVTKKHIQMLISSKMYSY